MLNAAEELFLQQGLDVSVRAITHAAATNTAAIHYYFGSRVELVAAVIERQWDELAKRRRQALDALEHASTPPTTREIVTALVDTHVDFVQHGGEEAQRWLDLMNTLWAERSPALALMEPKFTEFAWQEVLRRALPDLDQDEFEARLTFAVELILLAMRSPTPTVGIPTYPLPEDLSSRARLVIDAVVGLLEGPASQRSSA